jgi:hypothetical protein
LPLYHGAVADATSSTPVMSPHLSERAMPELFFLCAFDIPRWDGDFPRNHKYLWNHPDLSRKTKEKIAYHNAKEYFQLDRPGSEPAGRKAN